MGNQTIVRCLKCGTLCVWAFEKRGWYCPVNAKHVGIGFPVWEQSNAND